MTHHSLAVSSRVALVANFVLLLATITTGQERPDFSGHWGLLTPADVDQSLAHELDVRQSLGGRLGILEILTVERHWKDGVRSETHQIGIGGGMVGGVAGGAPSQDYQTRYSTDWLGNRLAIMNGSPRSAFRSSMWGSWMPSNAGE